jgi:hypothetical protein
MTEPDDIALLKQYAAVHRSARHYSVIPADRMIDGRMMETGSIQAHSIKVAPTLCRVASPSERPESKS